MLDFLRPMFVYVTSCVFVMQSPLNTAPKDQQRRAHLLLASGASTIAASQCTYEGLQLQPFFAVKWCSQHGGGSHAALYTTPSQSA